MTTGPMLIQGAMEVETDWLLSQLKHRQEKEVGGFSFWRGHCGKLELVVSRTGIGTIRCAAATALGLAAFQPCVVVNQGIAGAHREDLHVGDLVIGRSCIHIHDLKTPVRGVGEGSDPFAWEFHLHEEDQRAFPVYDADPDWAARFERAPYEGVKLSGRLGSGDVFNRETDRILWLRQRAGHLCEDMESAAAYEICDRFATPCVGLRIISNNELTGEPYQRTVGQRLQRFVLAALENTEGSRVPGGTSAVTTAQGDARE